jgi:hypothetical protein
LKPDRLNRQIQAELESLVALKVLLPSQVRTLAERYPAGRWNLIVLVRWFSILGAVSMGAGVLLLAPRLVNVETLVEAGLAAASVGGLCLGRWLGRSREMVRTGAALELLGAAALQGFIAALAIYHSTGSKDWPALVGIGAGLSGLLAYGLRNRLILIYALVNLFVWFGGETGYVSGWGMYWLNMTYPLRFLLAGIAALGVAYLHFRWLKGPLQGFSRVWAHFGLLVTNVALWFFALFGYFSEGDIRWDGTEAERALFSLLWAGASVASIYGGIPLGLRLLRGYGLTFLIINVYTFYSQFVAAQSGGLWFLHLLLLGGSMVAGGLWLERRRRQPREP